MNGPAWYYLENDIPAGPILWQRLVELSKAGLIGPKSLVRNEESNDWIYFSDAMGEVLAAPPPSPSSPSVHRDSISDARGWSTTAVAPWRRFGARMFDTTIHGVVGIIVLAYAWYSFAPISADKFFNFISSPAGTVFDPIITGIVAALVGGFVIGSTGSSIGKAIFGVKVVHANLQAIGIGNGLKREIQVWFLGLGLGIPLVTLFTMISAYRKLRDNGTTTWDAGRNHVLYRPDGPFQSAMNVLGIVLAVLVIGTVRVLNGM